MHFGRQDCALPVDSVLDAILGQGLAPDQSSSDYACRSQAGLQGGTRTHVVPSIRKGLTCSCSGNGSSVAQSSQQTFSSQDACFPPPSCKQWHCNSNPQHRACLPAFLQTL